MFTTSISIEVNPGDVSPVLSAEQVWLGLVRKAEDGVRFVPQITMCRVLDRTDDGIMREITIRGQHRHEYITFTPPVQVHYQRVGSRDHADWITNTISESERGLLLTFTYFVDVPSTGGPNHGEWKQGDELKREFQDALSQTVEVIRELVRTGQLSRNEQESDYSR